jgi:hypothetical protein
MSWTKEAGGVDGEGLALGDVLEEGLTLALADAEGETEADALP